MAEVFVGMEARFTSGWPLARVVVGLEPMYGETGWCHACGVPLVEQSGSLVLQRAKFPSSDFWMPNWQFDALCVRVAQAQEIIKLFRIRTMPVRTPRSEDTGVVQLLPEVSRVPWFDEAELAEVELARHGGTGGSCGSCGRWRWLPVPTSDLPAAILPRGSGSHFVASHEWFGDGLMARRDLRFSRQLAEALVKLNPRVWRIREPRNRV